MRGTHGRKSGPVTGLVREARPAVRVFGDYRDKGNHRSLENRERIKIMVACNKLNWYAAYTRVNQELLIKRKLDELGIENFLPQEEQVRETPVGRKKIRVL